VIAALLAALALAAIGGLGAFAVWWSHPAREARRLLAETPEKRIPELAEGEQVRVRGVARRGAELKIALLSERRCIGYRMVSDGSQKGGVTEWVDCAPFELVADGAVARVEGTVLMGLELDTGKLGFYEAILQDGDPIWVRGRASLLVDPRGTRDGTRGQPMLPVFRGTPQDPVVLARNGKK
jgi:hypothetical protein